MWYKWPENCRIWLQFVHPKKRNRKPSQMNNNPFWVDPNNTPNSLSSRFAARESFWAKSHAFPRRQLQLAGSQHLRSSHHTNPDRSQGPATLWSCMATSFFVAEHGCQFRKPVRMKFLETTHFFWVRSCWTLFSHQSFAGSYAASPKKARGCWPTAQTKRLWRWHCLLRVTSG